MLLSTVNVWEMQIKHQLGKLKLDRPLVEIVESQQKVNAISVLDVSMDHVLALDTLPLLHKDPFDRLLVAQANTEAATLVSKDEKVEQYPVRVLW